MKIETIIKSSESTKTSGVQAQPINRTEQIIDSLANTNLEILFESLINKDKAIAELEQKITDLEATNNDLDYLLNSGRNKFENERNKRLRELEAKESKELTKIRGILTSNLRTRTSADVPYMAFLRLETADFKNHSLAECSANKCKDCEIPVVFRIAKE